MIRVIVYNSNSLVLAGLLGILDRQDNLQLLGSFSDEASLVALSDRQPDLLLLERASEAEDLAWLERWMLTADFDIVGMLLTDYLTARELNEYLSLGFKAFLPRLIDTDEAIAAIEAAMTGLIAIHPDLAPFGVNVPAIVPLPEPEVRLTPREVEVLQLMGTGLNNQEIASSLQISKHTVKFHISSIFTKLDVSNRTAAVTIGLRRGSIEL